MTKLLVSYFDVFSVGPEITCKLRHNVITIYEDLA